EGAYLSYPYLQSFDYDSPGTTSQTQPIPGLAKLPGASTSVGATPANAQATVAWTAPADSGDSAITAYTVTSSPDGQLCTTNGATSCIVTGLTNGTSYAFTVRATSSVGTGPASAPSTAVTPATVPGAPAITLTSADNAQASIEFSAPVSDGGAAITGYTATSNPGGLTGTCSASPCIVTGLVNGLEYTFTLTATNQVGTGALSSPSSAVTPKTTPAAPTNVAASPGSGQARIHFDAGDNGGDAISNYAYSMDGGNTWTARVPAATTSPWIIEGLNNGTEYSVKIRAINSVGDGLASETVVVCPSASVFKDQFRSQGSAAPRCL
ncbi:MAG TPA: fibronectin type III domain-containing protein, partial [Wenzhouxiangella sp.]